MGESSATASAGADVERCRARRLLAAVAPDVNTIRPGSLQPSRSASRSRQSARRSRAAVAMRKRLEGFAQKRSAASSHAARAAGWSGAVALWSK